MFSGAIAEYNDYLVRAPYEEIRKNTIARWADDHIGITHRKRCQKLLARVIAIVVFPIFATIDAIANIIRVPFEIIAAKLTPDEDIRQKRMAHAQQCFTDAERCFWGALTSPLGLLSPDLITRHFVPKTHAENVVEAGGKHHKAIGREKHPKTPEKLQQLVREAIRDGKKVTISGAHMSQSADTLPVQAASVNINMRCLHAMTIDPLKKTVKVQAGATWDQIQTEANRYGLAVKVMQASNVFTVGGSIGVNCHGWDHIDGSLANTILSLTIIDAQGELQTLTPADELFGFVVGGHGFFGVVLEAEIALIDNELLTAHGEKKSPAEYVAYFRNQILPVANHRMHLYRLSLDPKNLLQEGVAVTYTAAARTAVGSSPLLSESEKGSRMDRVAMHVARTFACCRAAYWRRESKRILVDEKSFRNEIMRPPINAAFNNSRADAEWLQEYFVRGDELAPFLARLGQRLTTNQVTLLNATVRYVRADTISQLPYAPGEDMFAIVLFFNQPLAPQAIQKTEVWVRATIDDLIACRGTYYLPYQQFATQEQFRACYPQHAHVLARKTHYDPQRVFDNGLTQAYLP